MKQAVIYIHGKGGNIEEAEHYKELFEGYDVIGLDYKAQTPWEAKEEISALFVPIKTIYEKITLIANSIGAYFAMNALYGEKIERAYFLSPIVDMEKLIKDMMVWANVTEEELKEKGVIETSFGETLSWKYLSYVRENLLKWNNPTSVLYGEHDGLTSKETVERFVNEHGATLCVMLSGEHWFHTKEQMAFLDEWLKREKHGLHETKE